MMMSVVMDTAWNSVASPTIEGGSDCHWASKGGKGRGEGRGEERRGGEERGERGGGKGRGERKGGERGGGGNGGYVTCTRYNIQLFSVVVVMVSGEGDLLDPSMSSLIIFMTCPFLFLISANSRSIYNIGYVKG